MKLENLYNVAKIIDENGGKDSTSDLTFYLDPIKHENLQQEVYRVKTKSLQGYKSENPFHIILYNTKFILRVKR